MNRRSFLTGALLAAPAIDRVASIMPVKVSWAYSPWIAAEAKAGLVSYWGDPPRFFYMGNDSIRMLAEFQTNRVETGG